MSRLPSHVLLFFWISVCVRSQDPPSGHFHTDSTPPPCWIQIGDAPYVRRGFPESSTEINTVTPLPLHQSSNVTVTESVLSNVRLLTTPVDFTTSTATELSTTPTKPATFTPTAHPSPNSPEEPEVTTLTPTQSPAIIREIVSKNHEDGRNTNKSTNCYFDPCVHLQNTCFNTPDPTCRCPGVSSITRTPDSPPSLDVTAVSRSVALVEWCAPHSPVLEYTLVVRHHGLALKNLSFSPAVRQVFISDLTEYVYYICVQAVNRAGPSGPRCASVWLSVNTDVYLYSLLTACVVLTVIVGTLSVCLYKQCKKQPVENPHLTRLISIPNPAFFNL